MHCEWVERHLSAYLDGALDTATTNQVKAHLASCPHCSAIFDEYTRNDVTLKHLPRVGPPAALRERIFASPEFRELVQPRKHDVATSPITPLPTIHKSVHVARLVTQIAAVLIIVSGAGFLINNILAHQRSGPLYASCPSALSSGPRLVYRVGTTLYSGADKLVCDTHAQVGAGWQVSPDGNWVAYVNSTRGEVRLVRANATGDHAIDTGEGTVIQLAWSPDSQRLFIVKQVGAQQYTLAAVAPNQITAQTLAHFVSSLVSPHLAISSDGRYVAFQASQSASGISLIDAQTGMLTPISLAGPALDFGWLAGASARLTWAGPTANGAPSIRLANADGSNALTVSMSGLTNAAVNGQGVWALVSVDGTLTTYDIQTKQQTSLGHVGNVTSLAWSPDGAHIAVISNGTLWVVSVQGAVRVALNAGAFTPIWSADGASLTFGDLASVRVFNVNTNTLQTLTLNGIPVETPEWSQAQ